MSEDYPQKEKLKVKLKIPRNLFSQSAGSHMQTTPRTTDPYSGEDTLFSPVSLDDSPMPELEMYLPRVAEQNVQVIPKAPCSSGKRIRMSPPDSEQHSSSSSDVISNPLEVKSHWPEKFSVRNQELNNITREQQAYAHLDEFFEKTQLLTTTETITIAADLVNSPENLSDWFKQKRDSCWQELEDGKRTKVPDQMMSVLQNVCYPYNIDEVFACYKMNKKYLKKMQKKKKSEEEKKRKAQQINDSSDEDSEGQDCEESVGQIKTEE